MIFNSDFISNKLGKSPNGGQHENQDPNSCLPLDEQQALST